MLKLTKLRIVYISIAFVASSCATIKKSPEQVPLPTAEQNSTTDTTIPANNSTGKIQNVNSEQFNKLLLLDEVQLVDVRTKEEFQAGHINNASNMDIKDVSFKSNASKLKKNKPVLVYCRSGKRSTDAAEVLKELGFKKIVSLEGGILSWEEADLPINK